MDGAIYSTLFDDAMLSMRYARTLAAGHGLLWNPGAPRVQGFTNPGWTLIMAVVPSAGVPARLAAFAMMIARMAPAIAELVTGQNKWNRQYSIGQLRPDLGNLPRPSGDIEYPRSQEYHRVGFTCFVRAGARRDEARLAAGVNAIYPGSSWERERQ